MLDSFKLEVIKSDKDLLSVYELIISELNELYTINKELNNIKKEIRDVQEKYISNKPNGESIDVIKYQNETSPLYLKAEELENKYDILWKRLAVTKYINVRKLFSYLQDEISFNEIHSQIVDSF